MAAFTYVVATGAYLILVFYCFAFAEFYLRYTNTPFPRNTENFARFVEKRISVGDSLDTAINNLSQFGRYGLYCNSSATTRNIHTGEERYTKSCSYHEFNIHDSNSWRVAIDHGDEQVIRINSMYVERSGVRSWAEVNKHPDKKSDETGSYLAN